jgi:hypothetical protein
MLLQEFGEIELYHTLSKDVDWRARGAVTPV